MMMFRGHSANEVWREAAIALRAEEELRASRSGDTRELQDVFLEILDPRRRWIGSRQPPMNPAFALAEVVWILHGSNDAAFVNFWNPVLPKYAGEGDAYHGAYGWRLRHGFGFDQIERAYYALKNNESSRQVVLQIWDPSRDLPSRSGKPSSRDVPCNICSMLKVRNGRLNWTQVMRSNDLVKGLPHNVVQFTYLQELMAAWLGVALGSYTHLSDSLHIYAEDLDSLAFADEDERDILGGAQWDLGYDDSAVVVDALYAAMEHMQTISDPEELWRTSSSGDFPEAARNMLFITGSDAARRKGWNDVSWRLLSACTDRVLVRLLEAWYGRFGFMMS